jgi:uncharacterized membrane protein YfcA
MLWLVTLLAMLIGGVMGLTGAGGGILAVPVLVAGLHWSMQQAAPVALIAVATGAAVGALDGFRYGLVRYKAALLMAVFGIPVTRAGQYWASLAPQFVLQGGFAFLMIVVAWRFAKQSIQTHVVDADLLRRAYIHAESGKFVWTPWAALILSSIGALTGLMTGLLGVGGGFLMVPLLRRLTHLSMPGIVATSLFVITLVGAGGVLNAVWAGAQLPMPETAVFVAAMVSGMLMGRVVSRRLNPLQVQRGFAILLGSVALFMVYKAWVSFTLIAD